MAMAVYHYMGIWAKRRSGVLSGNSIEVDLNDVMSEKTDFWRFRSRRGVAFAFNGWEITHTLFRWPPDVSFLGENSKCDLHRETTWANTETRLGHNVFLMGDSTGKLRSKSWGWRPYEISRIYGSLIGRGYN